MPPSPGNALIRQDTLQSLSKFYVCVGKYPERDIGVAQGAKGLMSSIVFSSASIW